MATPKPTDGRIPFHTILAFSLATAPVGALTTPLLVNLPKHYGALGISLFLVGAIFAAVRILDIIVDPMVGMMMDRTRTRLGRYRVWLLASAPILMLGTWMLFFASPGVSAAYLFIWLGVMYIGFSILVLSQVAWGAVLAKDYDERSKVYAVGSVIGVLGAVGVLVAPILLQRTGAEAVHLMGWMILIALPVTILIVAVATPETLRITPDAHRVSLRDFPGLIKHHAMRRLLLADLLFTLGPAITSPLFLYFTQLLRGYTEAEAFWMLAAVSVAGLFGAPIWAWAAYRIGKHRALMLASVLYAIAQGTIPLIPAKSFWIILPAMFVAGAILSAFAFLVRAMVADVADEIRLETGKDRIGVLYSLVTSTAKIGTASAVFISLFLLGALGFNAEAGATNSPQALTGLLVIYTVPPVLMVLLAAFAVRGYSLSRERHDAIREALAVKDAEALAAAPVP
jgi:GPH family glycoside/pentoside/hexuronide:cation symporter